MKKQFGRSMIEMLGVLAIIGVLSIGGIALYRRAVNNHQANTILDDVNRFAFVIIERGSFSTNTFIDNIQYEQTSIYNLDAFLGDEAEQFGIIVTKLSKGICNALIDKASIEYKVRVLETNNIPYTVQQLSATGTIYDDLHKDICGDMNDVILYFGNTTGQCNDSGEKIIYCTSNADCNKDCKGQFCWYPNNSDCTDKGTGQCKQISAYRPETVTMSDGQTWTHSKRNMDWWSTQSWCEAQGLKTVERSDIGCKNVSGGSICNTDGTSRLDAILEEWGDLGELDYHWLEEHDFYTCSGYTISFSRNRIGYPSKFDHNGVAFCH